jgi:hypothetical protein
MVDAIWEWQCRMHISSCYLYEQGRPILDDASFDAHCHMLLRAYSELPQWFRDRVPPSALSASTAVGLQFSAEDIREAEDWIHLAHDWYGYYRLPVPSRIPPRPAYDSPHWLL